MDIAVSESEDATNYAPVYAFLLDGEMTKRTPNVYTSTHPKIGQEVTLYLNPDNTEEFYEPQRNNRIIHVLRIVGFVAMGVAVLVLIF